MSFRGFKKQINKANQFFSEKIFNAEATKLDEDFKELEKKTDATSATVEHLQVKTKEFLHPNPGALFCVRIQLEFLHIPIMLQLLE
jgi:endophilin-A